MPILQEQLEHFVYPQRHTSGGSRRLHTNPLDELDTLNHYAFGGKKDFAQHARFLTVNDHSSGDETIFLATQLHGTDSIVVHYDSCSFALETVARRAEEFGVAQRIQFVDGTLEALLKRFQTNPKFQAPGRFGSFDYVRCTSGLNDREDFDSSFGMLLRLTKADGVLGMSCYGYYGREPYRQMQQLGHFLNSDNPGLEEELGRLKELFPFTPGKNWTRMAFDDLLPDIRTAKDDAYIEHYLRPDRHALKVPQLYELLDRYNLYKIAYSRQTRMLYEPWFAYPDPVLYEKIQKLSYRDREAVSEIAWNTLEHHHFWAGRSPISTFEPHDLDMIPFFNPFRIAQRNWKKAFIEAGLETEPELSVDITAEEFYVVKLPWGKIPHRLVKLIDGFKTIGEIIVLIREEIDEPVGINEIARISFQFIKAVEREDLILLRHCDTPLLPMTARRLKSSRD